ncbi:acyl-CoA dehydrogenase family protein [Sphingobium sp. Sx8-8]|uniref:acyl-CoA dehydrogenase family protein n=1 Tax=Sphingobium sp. Sx8-8 TaxID=2933617 RepID=UPI001F57C295|nr:acyl-CoA dehydrogenase family protein [Sphingobium sp. Sx8-8]
MNAMTSLPPALADESYEMFAETVRRFFEREASPERVQEWRDAGIVPREVWRAAGDAGLLGASMPAELGGGGGDFGHEAILTREVGRHNLEGWGLAVHNAIVLPYFLSYANEEQKARWIPKLCAGEWICAIAMTEPHAGSDLQRIRTTARREGDEYVINGQKVFISNGQNADIIVVAAKTDPTLGAKGVSLIVVETADLPGYRRGRNLDKIGNEMSDTSELFFDDVRVPAENLLGGVEGKGFTQMMVKLPQERLLTALLCQGSAERALWLTLEYVKEREIFGQRLFDFQNTQFKLAEMKTETTISEAFVDRCVEQHMRGEMTTELASMAKLYTSELCGRVVDQCLQFFGGYGYMTEYPIARMYKDVRVRRILAGSSEVMKMIIARSL